MEGSALTTPTTFFRSQGFRIALGLGTAAVVAVSGLNLASAETTATPTNSAVLIAEQEAGADDVAASALFIATPEKGADVVPGTGGTVVLSGKGLAGSFVAVEADSLGTSTVVDSEGNWIALLRDVPEGKRDVVVTMALAEGGFVRQATSFNVVAEAAEAPDDDADVVAVSLEAPAKDTVIKAEMGTAEVPGTASVEVSGKGQPGEEVLVSAGDASGAATVAEDGSWKLQLTGLGVGKQDITAAQVVEGVTTTASVSITVEAAEGEDPDGDDADDVDVTILTPKEGDEVVAGDKGTVVFTGTGRPGAQVDVKTSFFPGTAKVDTKGNWTTQVPNMKPGKHAVIVTQTLADGSVSTATVNFTIVLEKDVDPSASPSPSATTSPSATLPVDSPVPTTVKTPVVTPSTTDLGPAKTTDKDTTPPVTTTSTDRPTTPQTRPEPPKSGN